MDPEIVQRALDRINASGAITASTFFEAVPLLMEEAERLEQHVDREEWVINVLIETLDECIKRHPTPELRQLRPLLRLITPSYIRTTIRATKGKFSINRRPSPSPPPPPSDDRPTVTKTVAGVAADVVDIALEEALDLALDGSSGGGGDGGGCCGCFRRSKKA